MVKITVTVKDNKNGTCQVSIGKPQVFKSSSNTEKTTANVVKNAFDNAIQNLIKDN